MAKKAAEKAQAAAERGTPPEGGSAIPPAIEEDEDTGPSVTVAFKGNTRVFSKDVHGKEYRALAKEFAEKHGGEIVK